MTTASVPAKVVLFSGGRGSNTIASALAVRPDVDLTIIVNAYDDGLSTGDIRRYVGILGPSDVRKNFSNLLALGEASDRALGEALEHRLDERPNEATLQELLSGVTVRHATVLGHAIKRFLAFESEQPEPFPWHECAFGNVVIAGLAIDQGLDFNAAIAAFAEAVRLPATVLNATDGTSLYLAGVKADGTLLRDEAAVVGPQSAVPIEKLALLQRPLSDDDVAAIEALPPDQRANALHASSITPEANAEAAAAAREADVIVYGPGTQHSSLIPTYMTRGLGNAIASNRRAEKVWVGNLGPDHESIGETSETLFAKVIGSFREAGTDAPVHELVTTAFLHGTRERLTWPDGAAPVEVWRNWADEADRHAGVRVADEMIAVLNRTPASRVSGDEVNAVSIVVPVLDEAATVKSVLEALERLDFGARGLRAEIIVVDGGSTDGSIDLIADVPGVHCITMKADGRGSAIMAGIQAARGAHVVVFPADGEYEPDDVLRVVDPLLDGSARIVLGSRLGAIPDARRSLRRVYAESRWRYLVSRYGGMTVSVLSLIRNGMTVGDPFTTLRAFHRPTILSLGLHGKGLDLDTELLVAAADKEIPITEVPVRFTARTWSEGKKATLRDGVRSLGPLIRRG